MLALGRAGPHGGRSSGDRSCASRLRRMKELGLDDWASTTPAEPIRAGTARADRGGRGPGKLVLPRRASVPLAPRIRSRAVAKRPVATAAPGLELAVAGAEEPYSIALTLLDLGLPARRFRIDAVDVSLGRLTIARRAVYSANAFRGSDLSYRRARFASIRRATSSIPRSG